MYKKDLQKLFTKVKGGRNPTKIESEDMMGSKFVI
jgi:hypothetical protein